MDVEALCSTGENGLFPFLTETADGRVVDALATQAAALGLPV
jgi:hypothetical protein